MWCDFIFKWVTGFHFTSRANQLVSTTWNKLHRKHWANCIDLVYMWEWGKGNQSETWEILLSIHVTRISVAVWLNAAFKCYVISQPIGFHTQWKHNPDSHIYLSDLVFIYFLIYFLFWLESENQNKEEEKIPSNSYLVIGTKWTSNENVVRLHLIMWESMNESPTIMGIHIKM